MTKLNCYCHKYLGNRLFAIKRSYSFCKKTSVLLIDWRGRHRSRQRLLRERWGRWEGSLVWSGQLDWLVWTLIRLVLFLWCDFTRHCRAHRAHPSGHHGHAALDQAHAGGGHAGDGRLGELVALAAHPGHSAQRGAHRAPGHVEEAARHPPDHASLRLRVVFLQVCKRAQGNMKGSYLQFPPISQP